MDHPTRARDPGERRAGRQSLLARSLALWLLLMLAETLHGIARTLLLQPLVGDLRARQIAVFSGSLIILGIATACVRWLGATRRRQLLGIGLLWLVLTLAFEVLLGRLTGASWQRIGSDYDPRQGGLLALGMAVLTLAPWLAAHLRRQPWAGRRG